MQFDNKIGTHLTCKKYKLSLQKPIIMGILNITPDSFYDGGKFNNVDNALIQAQKMVQEGANIIDVGGESTRPNADVVTIDEELNRVIPVIEKINANLSVPISIDTSNAIVMQEAVNAGASLINDVRALTRDNALQTAVQLNVPVCIMHMQGKPKNMQQNPEYSDVVAEVSGYLKERAEECFAAGIHPTKIILDPGFGFGKKLAHNLALLKNLQAISDIGFPVLAGMSRKSMFGHLLGLDESERLHPSMTANVLAYMNGANIFRVHDVTPTVQALRVANAVANA